MSKVDRLNARVEKLLSKAVLEVLDVVRETVSEYQEKIARTQRENQSLKRRLQELQEKMNIESKDLVPQISPASAEVEFQQIEEVEEDIKIINADKDTDQFKDLEVSITSVGTPCVSIKGATGTRVDNAPILNNVDPIDSENDQKMKSEPGTGFHFVNYFYNSTSSNRFNLEPSQSSSGLHSEPGDVFSLRPRAKKDPCCPTHKSYGIRSEQQHTTQQDRKEDCSGSAALQKTVRKQYSCSLCDRTFTHAGNFKKHSRVHTGEKPYCCSVCGKCFSQSGYLTVHLRYHTGEKPFSCSYCGKSFCHSSNMKQHEQTHRGGF
ncbi:zinc finger protein 239-like [Parambassis ranga]|uniref:Zinc finger protein 239-like n=1 Tax=Parambassis ranga TaxID=210632 RepID=A0A6P7KDZ4_9TELE|nr:zinc finger protein 239-like [Parambassis ranga]